MNILITGGAGFIGSHVCEFFIKKKCAKLIIIDHLKDGSIKNLKNIVKNKKVKLVKEDILNKNKIKKYFKHIDKVIHLAALSDIVPSIEDPDNYLKTNFIGTMNILECMRENGVKNIVYAASSSCYGIPKKYPTTEKDLCDPKYPYAFSKYIGEKLINHWSKVYGISYISLRLFNVYGTRSRTHGAYGAALGIFLKQKLENKPFTVVGNGNQKRDFINVRDVARCFYTAAKFHKKNQIYNVGSGKPISINYLTSLIGGKKIYIPKRPGEPNITHANIKKITSHLKWKPTISIKDGIKEVIENINYWKNSPLWTPRKIKKATTNWYKYLG